MDNKPQSIKTDDIKKLAQLARLGIDNQELDLFARDMTRLVEWVSILQAAPTEGLEPLTHPHDEATFLRDDLITEDMVAEKSATEESAKSPLFQNAPQHQDGFFLVPQVIS